MGRNEPQIRINSGLVFSIVDAAFFPHRDVRMAGFAHHFERKSVTCEITGHILRFLVLILATSNLGWLLRRCEMLLRCRAEPQLAGGGCTVVSS